MSQHSARPRGQALQHSDSSNPSTPAEYFDRYAALVRHMLQSLTPILLASSDVPKTKPEHPLCHVPNNCVHTLLSTLPSGGIEDSDASKFVAFPLLFHRSSLVPTAQPCSSMNAPAFFDCNPSHILSAWLFPCHPRFHLGNLGSVHGHPSLFPVFQTVCLVSVLCSMLSPACSLVCRIPALSTDALPSPRLTHVLSGLSGTLSL